MYLFSIFVPVESGGLSHLLKFHNSNLTLHDSCIQLHEHTTHRVNNALAEVLMCVFPGRAPHLSCLTPTHTAGLNTLPAGTWLAALLSTSKQYSKSSLSLSLSLFRPPNQPRLLIFTPTTAPAPSSSHHLCPPHPVVFATH